jgi:hypothetical protein
LENLTLTGNDTLEDASANIYVLGSALTLVNSILRQGDEVVVPEIYAENSVINMYYNDIIDGQNSIVLSESELDWFDSNIDADPLFADPDNSDYHLTEDSPCIDAGDPNSPLDPDSTRADMGAYYYHHEVSVPPDFNLHPSEFDMFAFPNPFNNSTTLTFSLPYPAEVALQVYDSQGRLVSRMLNRQLGTGLHRTAWNAAGLPAGTYLVNLKTAEGETDQTVTLVK